MQIHKFKRTLKFDRRVFGEKPQFIQDTLTAISRQRGISPIMRDEPAFGHQREWNSSCSKSSFMPFLGTLLRKTLLIQQGGLQSTSEDVEDEGPGENDVAQADVSREIDIKNGPFGLNLIQ